MNEEIGPNLAT